MKLEGGSRPFLVLWTLAVIASSAAFVLHLALRVRSVELGYELGRAHAWFDELVVDPTLGHRPLSVHSSARRSKRAANALPRWLIACFSSRVISANVRPSPADGTKTLS